MLIKKRQAKKSNRGLYIQDKALNLTQFAPGTLYTYVIDQKKKQIAILPSSEGNMVSKRQNNAVIDIRTKEIKSLMQDDVIIEIYNNQILITAIQNHKVVTYETTIQELQNNYGYEQLDLFFNYNDTPKEVKNALNIVSLFSGAGLLDKGFINQGFNIKYALEIDTDAVETYRRNIGFHIVNEDINQINLESLPKCEIMIGGTPCQGFSNNNRVSNYLDNPNNLLVKKFIEAVKANENCKIFVIENVPQLLTAGNGKFFEEIKTALNEFVITAKVLNASDFGSPQERLRAFIVGSKIGEIILPSKKNNVKKTVLEAFEGVQTLPNQQDISKPKPITKKLISYVKPGGNVKDIPEEIRPKGKQSNMYKRLEWHKPSITLVNPRKAMLLHPEEQRILSVRECARLQDVPDDFVFCGKLASKQQQVANGVPIKLAEAVAQAIKVMCKQAQLI